MLVAEGKPYLGATDVKTLMHLVHLITVPGTLLGQWEAELKFWFRPKHVDIIVYQGKMQYKDVWGEEGYINKSKHKGSHIIILTTHSVMSSYLFYFISADYVTIIP